jgi:hypothetical protein
MKTELKKVGGWTPLIDKLAMDPKYGLTGAAVFGVIWRHCQMRDGICYASQAMLCETAGIASRMTFNKYLKRLVKDKYIIDTTPKWKNRPHVYKDAGKLNMEISLEIGNNPQYGGTAVYEVITDDQENGVQNLYSEPAVQPGVQAAVQGGVQNLYMSSTNTLNTLKEDEKEKEKKWQPPHVSQEFSENENSRESKAPADSKFNLINHPTIQALKEITGYYPHKQLWLEIISRAPILEKEYCKLCFTQWVAKGYDPNSYDGWFFDWYLTKRYYMHPNDKARWQAPDQLDIKNEESETI